MGRVRVLGAMALAALTLLCSCGGIRYQEPAEGPRARVRFAVPQNIDTVGLQRAGASVYAFDSAECTNTQFWLQVLDGFQAGNPGQRLGIPLDEFRSAGANEVYVATVEPVHLLLTSLREGNTAVSTNFATCAVFINTTLLPGHDYEFVLSRASRAINAQCRVLMSEIVAHDGGYARETIATYTSGPPPSEACARAFRER